ncbi:MAG: hypothetical protein ACR2NZ_16545 [Rubripirellula sp.]
MRRLLIQQPLLFMAGATVSGVLLDSMLRGSDIGVESILGAIWLGLVAIGLVSILLAGPICRRSLAVIVFVPLGAWLHHHRQEEYERASIRRILDTESQPVVVRGRIDRPVTLRRKMLNHVSPRQQRSPWQTQFELPL